MTKNWLILTSELQCNNDCWLLDRVYPQVSTQTDTNVYIINLYAVNLYIVNLYIVNLYVVNLYWESDNPLSLNS